MEAIANKQAQEHAKGELTSHEASMTTHMTSNAKEHALATEATEVETKTIAQIGTKTTNNVKSNNTPMTK
jgi:hypothetical protein